MELISALSETQRSQEASFEGIKEKLSEYIEKLSDLSLENENLRKRLDAEKILRERIEIERNEIKEKLVEATESYLREFAEAKLHWANVESSLKQTTGQILEEMNKLENHNYKLEEQLEIATDQLSALTEKEKETSDEKSRISYELDELKKEHETAKAQLSSLSNELHDGKVHLLREGNCKEHLKLELKKFKKSYDEMLLKLKMATEEKSNLAKSNDDMTQMILKNNAVEGELKDVKFYLSILGKGNGTINSKIESLAKFLKKESVSVAVQTEMTKKHLSEYDNLDREATMLVMKMREELVEAKDELLNIKGENDVLKSFVKDVKRDRELKEDQERVQVLEEAVRALGEMVTKEQAKPTKEETIIQKLMEVKKDLDILKEDKAARQNDRSLLEPNILPIKLNRFSKR